ncbi:tyrosine-type recombinase/integrase [Azospirillum canadense]|uniref:tyrosine-type recombinase/integrase n=1 Tax=Azospirillum canadense TaxID=403962 RepID=UPI0022272A10|nr:tyrosine-type recombinase/integrase [Azospirillum canadense]MCW2242027.1 integrase [Azospirillum canadense]
MAARTNPRTGQRIAASTLARRLSSLSWLHRAHGHPDPTKTAPVQMKMKALSRCKGTRQSQALGIGRAQLDLILVEIGDAPCLLEDLRDAALLAVAYDSLLRRGELVTLRTEDIKVDADGTGLLYLARSKTDQEGQGTYGWLAPDTVRRVSAWLDARADALQAEMKSARDALRTLSAAMREGRVLNGERRRTALERILARLDASAEVLWLQVGKTGTVLGPLAVRGPDPGRRISEIFKRRAEAAGLDPALVLGHSLRVGAAQGLTAAGFGLPAIQQAGRWKSPTMPARYAEKIVPKQGAMAQLAGKQGRG